MKTSKCLHCNAPIVWARTPVYWLAFDAEPSSRGDVVLEDIHGETVARVIDKRERQRFARKNPDAVYRTVHDCPDMKEAA